ncbi:MAG: hypothetical protein LQ337_004735 [Flavoplaca oasis]|nr:MAG: hypothetical protein LQ337_004735 [Flavoplaca oasis]
MLDKRDLPEKSDTLNPKDITYINVDAPNASATVNLPQPTAGQSASEYLDQIFPRSDSTSGLNSRDLLFKREEGVDLIGNSTLECGFSTTTWIAQYENIADSFFYNFTLDFGRSDTSFSLDTPVGTYIYSDGREADDVPLLDIVHDMRNLDRQQWRNYQPTVNHTFHNGLAAFDDIDKIFNSGIVCKNETVPDNQQIDWIHDELRRKLLMDLSLEDAEEGICDLVDNTCPTPSTTQSDAAVATVGPPQDAGPPTASRAGYALYTLLWAAAGAAIGAGITIKNDLTYPPHQVQAKGVENVAELGAALGIVGSIMARQASLGVYNAPAERATRTLQRVGTVVRDRSQEIPSATRNTAMRGREAVNQNVIIAWLRGRLRRFLQELLAENNDCDEEEGICMAATGTMNEQPVETADPGNNSKTRRRLRKRQTTRQCVSVDEAFTLAQQLGSLYSTTSGVLNLHSVAETQQLYAPQARNPGGTCPALA